MSFFFLKCRLYWPYQIFPNNPTVCLKTWSLFWSIDSGSVPRLLYNFHASEKGNLVCISVNFLLPGWGGITSSRKFTTFVTQGAPFVCFFFRRFFQICFNRVSEKCGLSSLKYFKSESLTKIKNTFREKAGNFMWTLELSTLSNLF